MAGERGNFKSRVFGGFDRRDVIGYIEKLAAERNALSRENQALREKLEALEDRVNDTPEEVVSQAESDIEEKRRELDCAIEEVRGMLSDINREYSNICGDININVTQAGHELSVMSDKLNKLSELLTSAGGRLEELSGRFKNTDETEE